jgi:hypothetical protein
LERAVDILLGDKSVNDIKTSERLNQYIRLVQHLHPYVNKLPEEVQSEISQAYREITQSKKWAILQFVQLRRGGLPYDYWSSTGDFSLSRIKELIAQGKRETQQQLEDRKSLQEKYDTLKQEHSLKVVPGANASRPPCLRKSLISCPRWMGELSQMTRILPETLRKSTRRKRPFQNRDKLNAWLRKISTDAYKQRHESPVSVWFAV